MYQNFKVLVKNTIKKSYNEQQSKQISTEIFLDELVSNYITTSSDVGTASEKADKTN